MNSSDRAAQMILRTLALVGLGFWAAATAGYGLLDLAHGIRDVHEYRAFARGTQSSASYGAVPFGVSILAGAAFLLGLVSGAAGVLLGAVQVALAGRGALWCAGFTVLGLTGVAGAVVIEQVRADRDAFAFDYLSWTVLGALALPVIAVVVYAGALVALRLPRSGTFDITSMRVPSGSV